LFYSACQFFVFPSLYEGFGLPILEAMKCGAPLLTSKSSSIPEVAGDCAFYFDPNVEEEMEDMFWEAMESSDRVEELRRKGMLRAEQFTWCAGARKVLDLYQAEAAEAAH
jgi:glycosyltransferase involved in cell wall biosynthesis